ncbi:hypothetical protein GE21DRAFT_1081377 [Neurospora crassa]|nr:hypothetical protein GE21DRAFT_1081377 [Neurospora crassa]
MLRQQTKGNPQRRQKIERKRDPAQPSPTIYPSAVPACGETVRSKGARRWSLVCMSRVARVTSLRKRRHV